MLLHLMTSADWSATRTGTWLRPASLGIEGFVHCTAGDGQLLAVANRFYSTVTEPLVVLSLDESEIDAEIRYEAPAHPDGSPARPDEPTFPHVYGPVPVAAVRQVRELVRDGEGRFVDLA